MTCTGGGPCDVRLPNLVIESNDLICGTYQSTDFLPIYNMHLSTFTMFVDFSLKNIHEKQRGSSGFRFRYQEQTMQATLLKRRQKAVLKHKLTS